MINISEEQLIKRAQAGDSDAFCSLTRIYGRRLHMMALHYCRNSHDAEDLSQEVWLKAFKSIRTFRGDSSFYTWVRRVMVNSFLNHHRGHRLHLVSPSEWESDQGFDALEMADRLMTVRSNDLEEATDRKMLVDRIMGSLQRLTPQQRLIFLLKHREGLTYNEIAEVIGCSTGTVKKSLFRALNKLREGLGIESEPLHLEACAGGDD